MMGSSLPDKLNRPAWYLDFPRWQETRAAVGGNWEQQQQKVELMMENEEGGNIKEEVNHPFFKL